MVFKPLPPQNDVRVFELNDIVDDLWQTQINHFNDERASQRSALERTVISFRRRSSMSAEQ